jgi:DNA-binding CsgD family transcriptional regulator
MDALDQGRAAYAARAWSAAFDELTRADRAEPLGAEDVELLATSGYMLGRVDDFLELLERAHHAYLDAGEELPAVRAAFFIGVNCALRGEMGRAAGWFARAQRLVDRQEDDCVERGYLLLPLVFQRRAAGDEEGVLAAAAAAAELGERFRDPDLISLGTHTQGHALIRLARVAEGLALLDEAMLDAADGKLSPIITGVVYCGVIAGYEEAYELRRAQEWTEALARWCEEQPEMVAFNGRCRVHRSEVMLLHGAWRDALEEAERGQERSERAANPAAAGDALYQQGQVHRLRGDFAAAEAAYREANRLGREPQPGLALLRLAQGDAEAAAGASRRARAETADPLRRTRLLPAQVEIMLAVGDGPAARAACDELAAIGARYESTMLSAVVERARGAVELAEGEPQAALVSFRRALTAWQELGVPYEAAVTRVQVARACHALGDDDTAELELEAARATFETLGALPGLELVASLTTGGRPRYTHGLSQRELQVLRLVAAGNSNREIASALVVSEHTVARHLQNIFAKLRVSSRVAATAFAFEHDLL